jgi:phospholipase/carboxylesterase
MHATVRAFGPLLRAATLDTHSDTPPTQLVVLCHGFGAPADDLVPLAEEIVRAAPRPLPPTRFIFPEAPLDLSRFGMWGARAWWMIDMAALQRAMERGEPRMLAHTEPEGLPAARKALLAGIDAALVEAGLPTSRMTIGGFSQGAMLATDVALRLEEAPARLAVLSGTLVSESQWRSLAPRRRGLQTLVAHGRADAILPFAGAEALRDVLSESGLDVRFLPFEGGHTIDRATLTALSAALTVPA